MVKYAWISLLFLIMIPEVIISKPINSSKHLRNLNSHYIQRYLDITFLHTEYSQYVFLLGGMIIVSIIRYYIRVFEIPLPHSLFSIFVGLIWGILAMKIEPLRYTTKIFTIILVNAEDIYLPLIVFGTAFCIDVHAFIKSLPQILIISIPMFILNAVICGTFIGFVIGNEWKTIDGVLFGAIITVVYPLDILRWLKETNQTKQVVILLEGETIVTTAMCIYLFQVIRYTIQGWVTHWFHYLMGLSRILFINIPSSYVFGLLASCLMRISYQDSLGLSLITVITCFASYTLIRSLTTVGSIGALISGLMLGMERTSLPSEMEKSVTDLWKAIIFILNGMLFLIIGAMTPKVIMRDQRFDVYALVLVTYLICNIGRFICFFVFSPILSRVGYGMPFKNMVICVWGGLKHPLSLSLSVNVFTVYSDQPKKFHLFYMHCVFVYLLYLFINATFLPVILKSLGMTELSVAKQLNMNNCMKCILQAREKTIAILKMDRFLSDANWPLVMNATAFKHPYRKKASTLDDSDNEGEEEFFMGNRFSVCPDCKKRVPNDPTQRELRDMTKEAKLRLLKLRKIFYSRRFENGGMTKDGFRIAHQSVELAIESELKQIQIDGLVKLFHKESYFYRFLQKRFTHLLKMNTKDLQTPKNPLRYVCYRIIKHISFMIVLHILNVINLIIIIYQSAASSKYHNLEYQIITKMNVALLILYFVTFCIKILGLSNVYICSHGFARYFRSLWNIIHFIIMVVLIIDSVRVIVEALNIPFRNSKINKVLMYSVIGIRFIGVFLFLQLLEYYKKLGTHLIIFLDSKLDKYRVTALELGNNFICGEEEVAENIASVVDNVKIKEALKSKLQQDRLEITKEFGLAQKDRPWVATTVKTKLAITTVLKSMKDDLQELKMSGWVDDIEYSKLNKSLAERYRYEAGIKTVEPSSPTLIFKEMPWMGSEERIINYLYENATTKKFDPGDTICSEGEIIDGIYILIAGMFLLSYLPQKQVIDKVNEAGILPIVDYLSPTCFEDKMQEYIIPGNSIGELSILTDRPYNCMITAVTHSQVYVLRREIIKQAMEMDPDPINGLESRLWKTICYRIALPVLKKAASYHSSTMENIKFVINRSFVPNISNYKVFIVNEMMEDILLIEGVAVDLHTRDVYTGPCYIQRSVQKLILPKSSALNMDVEVETKLMVLPAKDFDEYEIMLSEEKICELVSYSSSRCLQHLIHDRLAKSKTGMQKRIRGLNKTSKKAEGKAESSRSKITFGETESSTEKPSDKMS